VRHVDEFFRKEVPVLLGAHGHVHHVVVEIRGPMCARKRQVHYLHGRRAECKNAVALPCRVAAMRAQVECFACALFRMHARDASS
jgi:hypothetical protein